MTDISPVAITTEKRERWSSYSAITQHRTCPQSWNYSRIQKLEPIQSEPAVERDFGLWWHALMAASSLGRGRVLDSLQQIPEEVTAVEGSSWPGSTVTPIIVLEGAESWWKRLSATDQQVFVDRLGEPLPQRLRTVYERWFLMWEEERSHEAPLAVELRWERSLTPGVRLVGYVDEVFLDRRRNVVVARDHKTHRTLGTQTAADDMMDSQLQVYSWGAAPTVKEWGLGPIQATAYDRVRMVAPKDPQITLAGSLSKSVTDYDIHTYLAWSRGPNGEGVPFPGRKKDGSDAGLYLAEQAVIDRLSSPTARSAWYQRTLVPLSRNVVMAHLRAAADTAEAIEVTSARVDQTGEGARNLTKNCRWCDFASLCRAQMVGGVDGEYPLLDFGLRRRK